MVADADPFALTAVIVTTAAGLLLVVEVAGRRPRVSLDAAGWAGVAGVALISTVVAASAFLMGIERVGASTASIVSTLEPVVTVSLAAVFFAERLSAVQLAGGALVLSGVVLLQMRPGRVAVGAAPDHAAPAAPARPVEGGAAEGEGWAYEPKWDGFRAIAFVDGAELFLQSRNGKALLRYFPEIAFPPGRYVLDGEIVAASFDTLGQRIHPAASRIARLAEETPARFVAFDLLAFDDDSLLELPYEDRRAALERFPGVEITPAVRTAAEAEPWLHAGEGVVAKELAAPYRPGERTGMVKVKRVRTIDAVVMGWRPGKAENTVGSLILASTTRPGAARGRALLRLQGRREARAREKLAPYATGETGSGDPSRWRPDHELVWHRLRPELVVEVTFDHVSDGRIRHGTKVQRWRDDKPPEACTIDQLDS